MIRYFFLKINVAHKQLESINIVVHKLEEKEKIYQTALSNLEKEMLIRQQALELHKRKAIENAQSAADLKLHLGKNLFILSALIFNDISERNDYYDALDFRKGGEVGVVTIFILEVPDYKSAMSIYFYVYINERMIQVFWNNFHEIHTVGACPLMGEPYHFWKQSAQ